MREAAYAHQKTGQPSLSVRQSLYDGLTVAGLISLMTPEILGCWRALLGLCGGRDRVARAPRLKGALLRPHHHSYHNRSWRTLV